MSFADNMRALRMQKKFSQAELAEFVGVTQVAINYFELGAKVPNVFTGVKIANKLGTTVEELVNGQTATAETVDEQTAERTDE